MRYVAGVADSDTGFATVRTGAPPVGDGVDTMGASPSRSASANAWPTSLIGPHGTPAAVRPANQSVGRRGEQHALQLGDQLVAVRHAVGVRGEPRVPR